MERVIVTVRTHGNTSRASVPLALDIGVRDGRDQARRPAAARGIRRRFHLGIGADPLLAPPRLASGARRGKKNAAIYAAFFFRLVAGTSQAK